MAVSSQGPVELGPSIQNLLTGVELIGNCAKDVLSDNVVLCLGCCENLQHNAIKES